MPSFSRIMKLAALFLPLVAALPAQSQVKELQSPKAQLPDGMAVKEAMFQHLQTSETHLPDGMSVKEAMSKHVPRSSGCADERGGVHVMVARGSTEPPGEGALGNLANLIKQGIPGSDSMGIDYPADLTDYLGSVLDGTDSLNQAIKDYVAQCPRSRIVLLGYSQGAQVVMNSLCSTPSAFGFTHTPRLEKKYWKHIAAALVYADPTHLTGKMYDRGTATENGMFPRPDPGLCSPFKKRLVAFCDTNDPVCASGYDPSVHTSYFQTYDNQAAPWLINKAKHHSPFIRHAH